MGTVKIKKAKIVDVVRKGLFIRATTFNPSYLYLGIKLDGNVGWYYLNRGSMDYSSTCSDHNMRYVLEEHMNSPWIIYEGGTDGNS